VFEKRVLRQDFGSKGGVKTEMEEAAHREVSRLVLLTKYYYGYQIDDEEMAEA
jgi:hypothetical protein